MTNTALITGVGGQDGTYLTQQLLAEGYRVFGISRNTKIGSNWRLGELGLLGNPNLTLLECDITNPNQVTEMIARLRPAEIYNLASHSFVQDSTSFPYKTSAVSGMAVLNLLEAVSRESPESRFVQAGSSELFGNAFESPQDEKSRFAPRNIYASAKLFAHSAVLNFSQNRGVFASNAILYNHESSLRSEQFVTRKITKAVAKIKSNLQTTLQIGNLSAIRDWGYAPEYVSAMRLIMNHKNPDVFVIATGKPTTVREFVRVAFQEVGITVEFQGSGRQEKGFDSSSGREIVSTNKEFFREAEVVPLIGDARKANELLGWRAQTSLAEIIREMVSKDISRVAKR